MFLKTGGDGKNPPPHFCSFSSVLPGLHEESEEDHHEGEHEQDREDDFAGRIPSGRVGVEEDRGCDVADTYGDGDQRSGDLQGSSHHVVGFYLYMLEHIFYHLSKLCY